MGRDSWSDRFMVEDCMVISAFDKKWKPELKSGSANIMLTHPKRGRYFQTIQTISTRVKPKGDRWWLVCPGCHDRVGKLYIPPGQAYLKCRVCHNLTYQSQKERYGQTENFWAKILVDDGIQDRETARKVYRNIFRKFIFNRHRR